MSRGFIKAIGIGNLCADPELRTMPQSEKQVVNLNIACNDSYKNASGQKVDTVEYVPLVFFDRQAQIAAEYLRKGSKIYVEGNWKTRSWEQDGQKRYKTEVVVRNFQMLDSRSDAPQQQAPQAEPSGFDDFDDSDIPWD